MINKVNKQQIQAKIEFLETQLESLNHYLPETYEFLMHELDLQKRTLAEFEVREFYQSVNGDQS